MAFLTGTLDLLILKTLSLGPQHGWGVAQQIQQVSRNLLQVNQGSLYPALHVLHRLHLDVEGDLVLDVALEGGTSEQQAQAARDGAEGHRVSPRK